MIILTHPSFTKHFKKRIAPNIKLTRRFQTRINSFISDPEDPTLKDHSLTGSKNKLRSFSVTGNIRVVYQKISKTKIILLDIGTHNQVY